MSDCIDHGKKGNTLGKSEIAHRVAYCFNRGIPMKYIKGLVIRHKCDNPRCINPQHLLIGTHQDNMDDRQQRSRQAKGVNNGQARLTDSDVHIIRSSYVQGSRQYGQRALGRKFGVNHVTIALIIEGVTWAHVQ